MCEIGDCFVISDCILLDKFNLLEFCYFLVVVDFELEGNLRLLDCVCRVGGFDATDFPRPAHIFVEKLLNLGLFASAQED